jgi:hypothetical protein
METKPELDHGRRQSEKVPDKAPAKTNGHGRSQTGRSADSLSLTVTTDDMRELLQAMQAMKAGDFSVRLPGDAIGLYGKISDTFNDIVAANQRMAQELERVGYGVGREGRTRQRVKFTHRAGAWGEMEGSVNTLIDDLLWPTNDARSAPRASSAVKPRSAK